MTNPQLVTIDLQSLKWSSLIELTGGGGFQDTPSASPYLWTIFFKADGETLHLNDDLTVGGSATLHFTTGSHGNLGTHSVGFGQEIQIPTAIGRWSTVLQPIPVPESLRSLVGQDEFDGTVGVIFVLMNQDHVSDQGAEAGHLVLNSQVQDAIAGIIATLGPGKTQITADDITKATSAPTNSQEGSHCGTGISCKSGTNFEWWN